MFPHIDNVDVYKYRNELDYSRFDADQAHITVCHVPWDVGLVHVGDRFIESLGNVVRFADEAERNAYISNLSDKFEFDTKYRRYHLELEIKLPIPVDRCAEYNYVHVHHEPIPNAADPVEYESATEGVKDWFFFIRELKYLAPNTTYAVLMLDVWQTFIYRFGISGVMLERGHYPLSQSDTDTFLSDPMDNSAFLLDPDVDAPAESVSASDDVHVFDDDVLFALFTSFDFAGSYGAKHQSGWNSPSIGIMGKSGYPAQTCIAVETSDAQSLLEYLQTYIPQSLGCIQACAFIPRELVEVSGTFVLDALTVYNLASKKSTVAHELNRADFAYPSQYAELAKLYTSPYASIVITDGADTITIAPQTVSGNTIEIITDLQLIADALCMRSQTAHVGGSNISLGFERLASKTFTASGSIQDLSILRDIPTYHIYIDNSVIYDNNHYWLNEQRKREADTAYSDTIAIADAAKADAYASAATDQANVNASAATDQGNANASAATDQSNANARAATDQSNANASALADYTNRNSSAYAVKSDADDEATTKTNNAALNTAANSLINGVNVVGSLGDCNLSNSYELLALQYDNGYTNDTTNAQVQANIQNAVISGVSDAVSSVATGAVAGSVIPGVGTIAGAIGGLVSAIPNAVNTIASTAVGVNLSVTQANLTTGHASSKFQNANHYSLLRTNNQNSVSTDVTNASNDLITDTTANESALIQGNAQRDYACDIDNSQRTYGTETANAAASYATETANAQRSYDTVVANSAATYATQTGNAQRAYDTVAANADRDYAATVANAQRDKDNAYAAVDADIAQAALEPPYTVCAGSVPGADAETPNYLDIQVRTMQPADVRRIGDEFLRFGYAYHGYVEAPDFAIMPRFSYWQCSEIFISNLSIPDAYADQIRYLLIGGVTVWSDPSYIGNTSIYDNVIGG